MKFQILFFIAVFSMPSYSEEMKISSGPGNELILTSSDCDSLLKTESALCEWKAKTDSSFKIPTNLSKTCLPVAGKKFKLTISACLPGLARNFHSKKMVNDGPNCWGTAMSFNGLLNSPRFLWPEEMLYWLDGSKLCRKLAPDEKAIPGDIINVFAPEKMDEKERAETDAGTRFWETLYVNRFTKAQGDLGGTNYTGYHRLLHSVTFISSNLAFGKDSPSRLDRFYFHPLSEVYGRPSGENESECQENQNLKPHLREYQNSPKKIKGSKCSYFTLAYRCENISEYFSGLSLSEANSKSWKRTLVLKDYQDKLFPLIFKKVSFDKKEIATMKKLADESLSLSSAELKSKPEDKTREMLLTLEYFTAAGIHQTILQSITH